MAHPRLRFIALGSTALAVASLAVPVFVDHKPERHFCNMGLAFTQANGVDVALEDQGDVGRDRCDINVRGWLKAVASNGGSTMNVLGFDCKVRNADYRVVATTTPNRVDGTCGQADR